LNLPILSKYVSLQFGAALIACAPILLHSHSLSIH